MSNENIKYSQRTCFVYSEQSELIGKIQFQREPYFKVWRVKYLSDSLPINSADSLEDIRQKLEESKMTWAWGKLKHYYGYHRH